MTPPAVPTPRTLQAFAFCTSNYPDPRDATIYMERKMAELERETQAQAERIAALQEELTRAREELNEESKRKREIAEAAAIRYVELKAAERRLAEVAAQERERCAKEVEEWSYQFCQTSPTREIQEYRMLKCAAAIRALAGGKESE